jgi:hypothetical protein
VTIGGTWPSHLRDEHPSEWAAACARQERFNALGAGMARKVGGAFLLPGETVADI